MLKADDLREACPQVQYKNGNEVTLEAVQKLIANYASQMGVAISFRNDQIKFGGLLNSKTEPCLIIYHPDHPKDYFNFCIMVQRQGAYAFVSLYECGHSAQMDKAYRSDLAKQGVKDYFKANNEMATGQAIGKAIGGALGSIGKSKKKLEEEKLYYQCLYDIFHEVMK